MCAAIQFLKNEKATFKATKFKITYVHLLKYRTSISSAANITECISGVSFQSINVVMYLTTHVSLNNILLKGMKMPEESLKCNSIIKWIKLAVDKRWLVGIIIHTYFKYAII